MDELWRESKAGNAESLKILLEDFEIDICKENNIGTTALELAKSNMHFDCAALINSEILHRYSNEDHPYRVQLRKRIPIPEAPNEYCTVSKPSVTSSCNSQVNCDSNDTGAAKSTPDEKIEFDEELFRQAAEYEPELAMKYLHHFVVEIDGCTYKFNNLKEIFGKNDVKTSALVAILDDPNVPSQKFEKLALLEHSVIRRILDIKWELFAGREYFAHLLRYILMLTAMTNIVVSFRDTEMLIKDYGNGDTDSMWVQPAFVVGVSGFIFFLFGIFALKYLKPDKLKELTYQWYKLDKLDGPIPYLNLYRAKTRWWLFYLTIIFTLVIVIPFFCLVQFFLPNYSIRTTFYIIIAHNCLTFVFLWYSALYFLKLEWRELLRDRTENNICLLVGWCFFPPLVYLTSRRPLISKYFASLTNTLQVFTYWLILVPLSILHCVRVYNLFACKSQLCNGAYDAFTQNVENENQLLPPLLSNVYFCLGAFCAFSLWVLSLQFLEVHRTAGYLLPILFDVWKDVWHYLPFYGVFQLGLTSTFYFLCHGEGYNTLWDSFTTTYFVMFGESGADKINDLEVDDFIKKLAMVLRMFHCAIMVVVLLNLLLATVNKTVDRNWDKLQERALASYARAILRIESMLAHTEKDRQKLLELGEDIFDEEIFKEDLTNHKFASDEPEDDHTILANKLKKLSEVNENLVKESKKLHQELNEVVNDIATKVKEAQGATVNSTTV